MKRALALALAGTLALAGCGEAEPRWPEPSPALWEVTGPGGQHGWLFGTIHSLPRGAKWRTGAVDDAFARASVLVVEIADLSDTARAQAVFYRLSTTPGLPPLSQRVGPAERPALAEFLGRAGVADDAFPDTETWGAALILANRVRERDPASGVDRALLAEGKPAVGLETYEEQYGVFDRLPPGEQADLLMAMAADAGAGGDLERKRTIDWLTGDIAALERDSAGGVLADPELREALQLARNRAWDQRIEQLLAHGETPLVAVGTAHMFGDEGLPALLAAHGYAVRRVQ